jgi:hypothetical protein
MNIAVMLFLGLLQANMVNRSSTVIQFRYGSFGFAVFKFCFRQIPSREKKTRKNDLIMVFGGNGNHRLWSRLFWKTERDGLFQFSQTNGYYPAQGVVTSDENVPFVCVEL